MSVKMALAKLSATAAGTALLAGGAVHVAETQAAQTKSVKSVKSVKAQPVKRAAHRPVAKRHVPKTVQRQRRIVRREVECVPAGPGVPVGRGCTAPRSAARWPGQRNARRPTTMRWRRSRFRPRPRRRSAAAAAAA